MKILRTLIKNWSTKLLNMATCYVREAISNTDGITIIFTDDSYHSMTGKPMGGWCHLNFSEYTPSYIQFMECFLIPTLDVLRLIAKTYIENIRITPGTFGKITILDPTFTPPVLNRRCKWQMDMLNTISIPYSVTVIATCMNAHRLRHYINSVKNYYNKQNE